MPLNHKPMYSTTSAPKVFDANNKRVALSIQVMGAYTVYVSTTKEVAGWTTATRNGFAVRPQQTLFLSAKDGWDLTGAIYVYSDANSAIFAAEGLAQ